MMMDIFREKERFRADELQVALEESELRCQKQEESFGQEKNELVKKLEEEKMKTVQLASELKDKLRELTDQYEVQIETPKPFQL